MEDLLPRGPARQAGLDWHAGLGALVMGLSMLRLLWRAANLRPVDPPGTPAWQARAAHLAHGALYATTLAVPLTGILEPLGAGPSLRALRPDPHARSLHPALRPLLGEAHELLAHLLLLVVAAHVAAALWHHLVLRDGVLRRMLPGEKPGRG
ncbi:cytochrome b [Dankookia sp. P2]|uniref:cytochrome b n=1 Tax=Dankookia sp. P2 TaxID=3423955 RepID=UPI003D6703BF